MKMPSLLPGTVHANIPPDVLTGLSKKSKVVDAWNDITPLARNEFLCWITSAKQASTRERRIRVAVDKLDCGERRPCCWAGCIHRPKNGK